MLLCSGCMFFFFNFGAGVFGSDLEMEGIFRSGWHGYCAKTCTFAKEFTWYMTGIRNSLET
jgi:hypothetical protein